MFFVAFLVAIVQFNCISAEVWQLLYSNPNYTNADIDLYNPECLREAGITSEELIGLLSTRTEDCRDPFELDDRALCYLFCIRRYQGVCDKGQNPIPQGFINQYYYLNQQLILNILDQCVKQVDSAQAGSDRKCWRSFAIKRCFDTAIGAYPPGTHHVPIATGNPEIEQKCLEMYGVQPQELCHALTDRCEDHFVNNNVLQCYHSCVLESMGLVSGDSINVKLLRQIVWYIEQHLFDQALEKCKRYIERFEGRCEKIYEYHRCFKRLIGEYPIV